MGAVVGLSIGFIEGVASGLKVAVAIGAAVI
jgi:hypothetical protein